MQWYRKRKISDPDDMSVHFENERRQIMSHAVSLGALLCATLVPLFSVLDFVFKADHYLGFLVIRLSVTIICLISYFISKTALGKKCAYQLMAFIALAVCGSISMMCAMDMGPADPYYAGINLPVLGIGIMFPLRLTESLFVLMTVWLSYIIPNSLLLENGDLGIFVSNNFFMIGTIIISIAGSRFNFIHTREQWETQQKVEEANRWIQDHAQKLEKRVQERTQKLLQSERLAVVGQLAGGVAHDFNNIMTTIMGISEIILQEIPRKSRLHTDIEIIHMAGKRATALIQKLLAFSRRQILNPKILDLNRELQDLRKILCRLISEHIEIRIKTCPKTCHIRVDPVQIEQIVFNLAVNARDAMPDGGDLTITTDIRKLNKSDLAGLELVVPSGEYVILSVSDTGKGMTEEIRSKIFEPFFTTKGDQGQGTGLGLSTVYGIIKQSNGDILVKSELDKGTTFEVYLPRINTAQKETKKPDKQSQNLPRGRETILLVEDEDEVRKTTVRMLKKQGYHVLEAKRGHEALSISKKFTGQIDLLVTDAVMPRMNGQTLAKKLTAQRNEIKVLFLSGYSDSSSYSIHRLQKKGAFLQKPYTMQSLSYTVRNMFDN